MKNILTDYSIFVLKILTIIIIIMLPLFIFFMLFVKNKNNKQLKIINLNKKYLKLRKELYKDLYKKKLKNTSVKLSEIEYKKNLFILTFNGDINANETNNLKEIISLVILEKNNIDEVLLKLTSSGGVVNNYGFAASQLKRLINNNIKLTISIDLIAASGGYMMACVGSKIIASHFAILGSIGVLGIIPNFNKFLTDKNIEIEYHTSGEYKSTLSMLGKNTDDGRKKFMYSLENTHKLFKLFIKENRPQIDINAVSTGEYWYGKDALELNLIDKIQTSDEYIFEKIYDTNIYEISINEKKSIKTKLNESIKNTILKFLGMI